jgi:hypothetical protein
MTVHFDPDAGNGRRWACNMRWCVMAGDREVSRGPYWRCKMISRGIREIRSPLAR